MARLPYGGHGGGRRPLTRAEHEVVRRLALGQSYAEVAHSLGVSIATVKRHRTNAGEKHGGGSLVDLLRELRWLTVPNPRHPENLHG